MDSLAGSWRLEGELFSSILPSLYYFDTEISQIWLVESSRELLGRFAHSHPSPLLAFLLGSAPQLPYFLVQGIPNWYF